MDDVKTLRTTDTVSIENDRRILAKSLPVFKSSIGAETLACGSCGGIIAQTVTTAFLYENLRDTMRVIVTCVCGANNILVSERRNSPR